MFCFKSSNQLENLPRHDTVTAQSIPVLHGCRSLPKQKISTKDSSYPSTFPFVPSKTSTSLSSARHQFTEDSFVLPVCLAESYTLTRPTCIVRGKGGFCEVLNPSYPTLLLLGSDRTGSDLIWDKQNLRRSCSLRRGAQPVPSTRFSPS